MIKTAQTTEKRVVCLLCGQPAEEIICLCCAVRIQGEAIELKREAEKRGRIETSRQ